MKIVRLLIIGLLAASCSSPLDIDTPREKVYGPDVVPSTPVAARSVAISFSSNNGSGIEWIEYDCVWNEPVRVDTSGAIPAIWLRGTCRPKDTNIMIVPSSLEIRLDSLAITGAPQSIVGGTDQKYGAKIGLTLFSTLPEFFVPDGTNTTFMLTLTHNRGDRVIEGAITIGLTPGPRAIGGDGTIRIEY